MRNRVGLGFDVHPFGDAPPLVLGGVHITDAPRLAGHSDGDAVAHAVADALARPRRPPRSRHAFSGHGGALSRCRLHCAVARRGEPGGKGRLVGRERRRRGCGRDPASRAARRGDGRQPRRGPGPGPPADGDRYRRRRSVRSGAKGWVPSAARRASPCGRWRCSRTPEVAGRPQMRLFATCATRGEIALMARSQKM